jgi:hypothetical protein
MNVRVDDKIYTWVPGPGANGTIVEIADNGVSQDSPQVSGNRIVWVGYGGSSEEIFTAEFNDPQSEKPVQSDDRSRR